MAVYYSKIAHIKVTLMRDLSFKNTRFQNYQQLKQKIILIRYTKKCLLHHTNYS